MPKLTLDKILLWYNDSLSFILPTSGKPII